MKDADDALSSSALASTVEPSGAVINTRQVISSTSDVSLVAACISIMWGLGLCLDV